MGKSALRFGTAFALAAGLAGSALAQGTTAPGVGAPPRQVEEPAAGPTGSPQLLPPATIKEAQQQLKSEGLYTGEIDGRIGPEMTAAVRQYQLQNGLKTTAMLDEETLQHLMGKQGKQPHG